MNTQKRINEITLNALVDIKTRYEVGQLTECELNDLNESISKFSGIPKRVLLNESFIVR